MSNVTALDPWRATPASPAAAPGPAPASVDIEQAFLGSLLLNNDVLLGAGAQLEPEHFTEEAHRRVFAVARDLIRSGKIASPVTLGPFLPADVAPNYPMRAYLAALCGQGLPLESASHAQVLVHLHGRRGLAAIGDEVKALAMDPPASATVDGLIDKVEERLAALRSSAPVQVVTRGTAGEMSRRLIERIKRIRAGEEQASGIATGLPELDRDTGGLSPGKLWIVAGRPSMGKTIFATRLARFVGRAGAGALLFSLEVSEEEINARLLADMAYASTHPITYRRIVSAADLTDEEMWRIEEAQERYDALPVIVDCPSGVTVSQIASRVRAERLRMAKVGVKLGAVIIDYLDFIHASDRYRGNRVYEVAEISRGLKQLAKDQDVCVVLLAQINRQVEQRHDKRPMMSDLRDSGNLEQDADVIALVYREAYYLERSPEYLKGDDDDVIARLAEVRHDLDLIIGKNRAGPTRVHKLWCDVSCSVVSARPRGGA